MTRRTILQLEELGQRILPSATLTPAVVHARLAATPAPPPHPVSGHMDGDYTYGPVIPDAGIDVRLTNATAVIHALGRVSVTGAIHSLGYIQSGQAMGELTLSNRHGSVTIELEGPPQPGFSSLPPTFTYQVIKATGAYQNVVDQGTLTLTMTPAPTVAGQPPHGMFIVVLK
jgi:hypothetical protein